MEIQKEKSPHTDTVKLQSNDIKKDFWILISFLLVGSLVATTLGQDANWDLLNYHYYNVWNFLENRNNIDYFAAFIQTYFNPILDFPFYLLLSDSLSLSPKTVTAIIGLQYGLILFVSYLISRLIAREYFEKNKNFENITILTAVFFSSAGSALWSQIGTTTNEIPISFFILLSFFFFFKEFSRKNNNPRIFSLILIGAMIGIASGLKLTAIIYAPVIGLGIIFFTTGNIQKIKNSIIFSISATILFLIVFSPWAIHLYRETGNPFFPMLNNLFQSPWWSISSNRDLQFIPKTSYDYIFYPFYWALHKSTAVSELPFRDPRIAIFLILVSLLSISSIFSNKNKSCRDKKYILNKYIFIAAAGYAIWLVMFSILRYTIAIEVLISIIIPFIIIHLISKVSPNRKKLSIITALFTTIICASATSAPNWGRVTYGDKFFEVEVPKLPENSAVIFADAPLAFIAPFLHEKQEKSRFLGVPFYLAHPNNNKTLMSKTILDVIQQNNGPIFAAYYSRTIPKFEWLASHGLSVNHSQCNSIKSNVAADILLCPVISMNPDLVKEQRFTLHSEISKKDNVEFSVNWNNNSCTPNNEPPPTASIKWETNSYSDAGVTIFVKNPPSKKWNAVVSGSNTGNISDISWISSGISFQLRSNDDKELATASIIYKPCN